ncbi:unnamed protein product, partial [Mesorhabditis belari]|uniref:Uncharacterized protein n=1 Tax=Mesorhabditis belari TaxID=2138241 RepID=A0AAF3F2X5_9BILA
MWVVNTTLFLLFSAHLTNGLRLNGRENRATRMSVVDFWRNETEGDGLNVKVAHAINSWPDLVDQLHEPFLNKSLMIEGDVFLQAHRRPRHRTIPVMQSRNSRMADRITFRDWLREVANLKKAIKINFRTTEVVRPVLQYLYASQADPDSPILDRPVILHANVFRAPRSVEPEVDPGVFVERTQSLFPDATISLGWTRQQNLSQLNEKYKKLTWHTLFMILEHIAKLDQPVMLSVRLSVAQYSTEQLLWLLGMDKSVSLLIWSDDEDNITNWEGLVELRKEATRNRILYDLLPQHRDKFKNLSPQPIESHAAFDLSAWRSVEFPSTSSSLSAVVRSEKGPAFIGQPVSLLISQKAPPTFPDEQFVEGKVHFLPKSYSRRLEVEENSGVSIHLLDRIKEIDSPKINKGIEVFIGYGGTVFVENKQKNRENQKYYESKSLGQLPASDCYGFKVTDRGWRVTADVWTEPCLGHKRRKREVVRIELDTPFQKGGSLRNVIVSKSGDDSIDFLLESLRHSSTTRISIVFSILFIFLYQLFH